MELLVTCGIESHPMIENYSFARVNSINIHFFLPKQTNVTEKRQMSTNKQASTLFNVLLRFKYVKLQKFTLYVHFFFGTNLPYFSACLWQFMQSFFVNYKQFIRQFVRRFDIKQQQQRRRPRQRRKYATKINKRQLCIRFCLPLNKSWCFFFSLHLLYRCDLQTHTATLNDTINTMLNIYLKHRTHKQPYKTYVSFAPLRYGQRQRNVTGV